MLPSMHTSWLSLSFNLSSHLRDRARARLRFAGVLAVVAAVVSAGCGNKEQAAAPPPPDVEVAEVVQKDVPVTKDWVATFDGFVNAQIRAQVTGYLLKQEYNNGTFVKKGTPLFQIDPRPFQATLDQAQANLAAAQGNLGRAQAQLGKTDQDVARYTPLAKEQAISQQELDDAVQADLAAKAQVDSAKADIDGAKAAIDTAKLNLGFTSVVSPIEGVAAISTAQVGDLVGPGAAALTTVSTINPILVNFTPSEQEYLAAATLGGGEQAMRSRLDFQLTLTDGSSYPYKGKLYAVNREIDVRTGAVLAQAQFPNPDNLLRPGGFARISTVTRIQKDALLVPARAVSELQGGYLLAVVGADNKVSLRPVKVGARAGAMWIVTDGVQLGDRVVAEGIQKVRDGLVVNPKPFQPNQPG